ncbi:MAG: HYR domain-containing protein, partial [Planctomycetes bacterium]|nr:HYR domain-containing protein [Planctomycetota bacterium]
MTSVTPLDGGCVYQDSVPTTAVERWDVQQGKTYRVTLSNLTDRAHGGTDSTIKVLVKSSSNGNQCLTATKQSTGVYTFAVTMPPNACLTYPIQYGVEGCSESTDESFIARRADGAEKASHLNAATFGAGCSNPTDDTNCSAPSTITLQCPTGVTACTDPNRCDGVVRFEVSATTVCPPSVVVCNPPSGSTFVKGPTLVNCTGSDAAGTVVGCQFTVTVADCQAPNISCPGDITAECTSPNGAAVTFSASATDNCDASLTVSCVPSSGSTFSFGATQVCCTATDDDLNSSPCCFRVTVVDHTAPSIHCPSDISAACTSSSGAAVSFSVTASDVCDLSVPAVCDHASGSTFPFGTTRVCCTATDDSGNSAECCFNVTVTDTVAPAITCPGNITAECSGPSGATVVFEATATDACDPNVIVVCSPASGATFGFGTTPVCCTATDSRQNSSRCCFDVTVIDSAPPAITCPTDITAECTSASGAAVSYTVTARDKCDLEPAIVCSPASGSSFPFGTTEVCCTATDGRQNSSRCCFHVTVVDRVAPQVHCPADITAECTSASGAAVTFTTTATDTCDATPTIVCTPASGSNFAFGTTQVCCTATDDSNNASQCCFSVTIVDTIAPSIHCSTAITAECTSASGAAVSYSVTATDTCDPSPTIACSPASGSVFGFGITEVCCTATDASKNSARCCFNVTVVDTTPPAIQCPENIYRQCQSADGKPVTFTVTATDACDPNPTIACDHASGATFPIGETQVCCTATDPSQNSSRCCFTITIVDTRPPSITCPPDITAECTSPSGATVPYTVTATDTCDPNPTLVCSPASGTVFGFGTTQVCCTATDHAKNSAQCCFNVTVVDTTPPAITCPENISRQCQTADGKPVTFTVTATDACDPNPTIACDHASGATFPIGQTEVCCTATDPSQNSSRCCFTITIVDTQPPTITCPTDITAECTDPNGATVSFTVTATDTCDPNPTIVCSPASGTVFDFGTTQVCCTATDHAKNSAQCCFNVIVVDTTPPAIACPSATTVECSGPTGATVTYTVTAPDLCDSNPTISCVPPSGSLFPYGLTQVCCTATDDSKNSSQCCFNVTVVDYNGPTIHCPTDITAECTSANGASVTFTVTASAQCAAAPTVACDHESGATFPFGTTQVCCIATDAEGGTARCCFNVTVLDTVAPSIRCPETIRQECTGANGKAISFSVTASDLCDPDPTIVCDHPSGSTFPIGTTRVCCTATDDHTNSAQCCFDMTIVDSTAPHINCPNSITAECTSPSGATVTYSVTATDTCDSSVTVVCDHPSGSAFPFGATRVCCTATDDAGNSAPCCFDVTVVDTTPPTIRCPRNTTLECTSPSGATGTYTVTATDNCDSSV